MFVIVLINGQTMLSFMANAEQGGRCLMYMVSCSFKVTHAAVKFI